MPVQGSVQARPGCSVIVQPVGAQTKPTITSQAQDIFRVLQLASTDVDSPEKVASLLLRIQQNLNLALRPIAQNPIATSLNLIRGLVFTGGQTRFIAHGLGHAYQGWWCCRAQTNPAVLVEAALPTGTTPAQFLGITSTNAGTYDIIVF